MKPRVLSQAQHKLGVVVHPYSPSPWEAEAGASEVQGYLWLRIKFEVSLGCMRLCFKK